VSGSLTIQGGATANANASVNALGSMSISTVAGAVQLIAGSAGSATIDPPLLDMASNGDVLLQGGGTAGAFANIDAGTFNLAGLYAILLQSGVGGASITSGSSNIAGAGALSLLGGTMTVTGTGQINIAGLCTNCGTSNLFGAWSIFALSPSLLNTGLPNAGLPVTTAYNDLTVGSILSVADAFRSWELVTLEDGTLSVVRARRNQCY
jgi:hypothetical protein